MQQLIIKPRRRSLVPDKTEKFEQKFRFYPKKNFEILAVKILKTIPLPLETMHYPISKTNRRFLGS